MPIFVLLYFPLPLPASRPSVTVEGYTQTSSHDQPFLIGCTCSDFLIQKPFFPPNVLAYNFFCQILTEFESFKPEKVGKRLVRIELPWFTSSVFWFWFCFFFTLPSHWQDVRNAYARVVRSRGVASRIQSASLIDFFFVCLVATGSGFF